MTELAEQSPRVLEQAVLEEALRNVPDGVAIVETRDGLTVVAYGNATLAALLRRPFEWLAGRLLADVETEAPADPTATSTSATGGIAMRVRLRRVDGSLLECERWAVMLGGAKVALYYRPLPRHSPGALAASLERATGVSDEAHLLDMLHRDWSIGQRDGRTVTLMHFRIDSWPEYREVFQRGVADNVVRQVGRTIASITRRASDVVARTRQDDFLVLGVTMDPDAAYGFAQRIVERVRSLSIHHPRSSSGRFLTVSVGVVTAAPPRELGPEVILQAAQRALDHARSTGGNDAVRGEL